MNPDEFFDSLSPEQREHYDNETYKYRARIGDGVDKLISEMTDGGVTVFASLDNGEFVSTEVLDAVASAFSILGQDSVMKGNMDHAESFAYCATLVNVLSMRASGKEPNDFGDLDDFLKNL